MKPNNPMFFKKKTSEPITKNSIKKMDAVITTVVLGGVIGSIYGIKKLKEMQSNDRDIHQTQIFEVPPPKKRGFWARIFGRK